MSESKRMVVSPVGPPSNHPEGACWQVMFEGFENSSPLPRGWRGTIAELLEQIRYVATNHDMIRGVPTPDDEEWRERVERYQAFWDRYSDDREVRMERDQLKAENERLREALEVASGGPALLNADTNEWYIPGLKGQDR